MTSLPRTTFAAIIGAIVLSTLSVGAAVGPARAATPSSAVGASSNGTGAAYAPIRM